MIVGSLWSAVASGFEFYPPFLPANVAANETITQVELRLYLAANESGRQVRVTPVSDSIQFTPSQVVFSSGSPVAYSIAMVARDEGTQKIQFLAQVEQIESGVGVAVAIQNATEVAAETINVLSPPQMFAIDDQRWHGVVLVNDSFESPAFSVNTSSLWDTISHGYPSSACGALDGSKALYFTALGDRSATTKQLDLLGFDGKIHFHQLYGYRSSQDYDDSGDNRVSCEQVDKGEEIVLSYLPVNQSESNASAWIPIVEAPLSAGGDRSFASHSVVLPRAAMQSSARFRWHQKAHSSFPVDPVSGLSPTALLAAENDASGVDGNLGIVERELWQYRNLFDQWAIDDVRLEVRLSPPMFQIVDKQLAPTSPVSPGAGAGTGDVIISVGFANVSVNSPVTNTWTEFKVGDGTHAFPTCNLANIANADSAQTVRLDQSGYIHAVACLNVFNDGSTIASSFPTRSQRILVQAAPPTIATSLDKTTIIDTWTVQLHCDGCSFMRYTAVSSHMFSAVSGDGSLPEDAVAHVAPSCSYGTFVDGSDGSFQLSSDSRVFAIACGSTLIPSEVTSSDALSVAPRVPTFVFTSTPTTITNEFVVEIQPPGTARLGVAYTVSEANAEDPVCPPPGVAQLGPSVITARASDVIRAISCCLDVHCVASEVAIWGPLKVRAVAPVYSMECSHTKPLTVRLRVSPVTVNAWIQYQIGSRTVPLDCSETENALFTTTGEIEVAMHSTGVFAVSCLHGLQPSDQVEIPVVVDTCCAGLESYTYPSCAHVLLLYDDFMSCLNATKWSKVTSQWGGADVNGGVHAENVHCAEDDSRAKRVLQLRAHGDLFPGTFPVGTKQIDSDRALEPRTRNDLFVEWALDGVSPTPCSDPLRCPARRVGAAIQTAALAENAGVMVVRLKPCAAFGTLTQIWWGDYPSRDEETLQQVPFLPLWKAGMYQAKTTSEVSFVLSSPTNLPLEQEEHDDNAAGTGDGFIQLAMQWNATMGRSNLYVNGVLVHKQMLSPGSASLSIANEPLSLGVWFPNAVAGEPLFETCDVVVDHVSVYKAQITGERWCDFEQVNQTAIACESDRDCQDWVSSNCFMSIHEAVCIDRRMATLQQVAKLNSSASNDHLESETESESCDQVDAESEDKTEDTPHWFCQFRLQPAATQADPTASLSSTTEMTQRLVQLQWATEEGASEQAFVFDEDDGEDL